MDYLLNSFSITTLGCKVNRYESEAISETLIDQGWHYVDTGDNVNLCIVNTCTVTGKAGMQSRQAVKRMVRSHPGALVLVTGCYAQVAPEVFTSMPEVHFVLGNTFKDQIATLLGGQKGPGKGVTLVEDLSAGRLFQDLPITRFGQRTRAFVKIQDGCDAFCSYCIVPFARGRSRSLEPQIVEERIKNLGHKGYREVVLSGIHIGRYGHDLTPPTSLRRLVCSLDESRGIERIRLSSIEPMELSQKLISHIATSYHICPHIHIPLKSGDDAVLKAMKRPYTANDYRLLIHEIVQAVPHVSIGVDVMGGFPGETNQAFENTCRLIQDLPVAYLHVFPFSVKKGTGAEQLPHHLSWEVKRKRCGFLRDLGEAKRRAFYQRFVGLTLEVLVEGKRDKASSLLRGFTKNYIPVLLQGDDSLIHQIIRARIDSVQGSNVYGTVVTP